MKKFFKSCLLLFLIEFCSVTMISAAEQNNEKKNSGEPIFIDSRLMILAHPLFRAFDPKSKRFKGTSSESFQEDFDSQETFIQEIKGFLSKIELVQKENSFLKRNKKNPSLNI